MIIRKTGGESTLKIIDGVLAALPDIRLLLPEGMTIKPIFNQAVFVKAALRSVLMGGLMAAVLTGLMILLFLGNWRLTSIILVSIPLSDPCGGHRPVCPGRIVQHDDAGRLRAGRRHPGGQRHRGHRKHRAPPQPGPATWRMPSSMARRKSAFPRWSRRLAICIVFVPIFLLQGTSKYLFSPLAVVGRRLAPGQPVDLLHPRADALQAADEEVREASTTCTRPRRPISATAARPPRRTPMSAIPPRVQPVLPARSATTTATTWPGRCITRSSAGCCLSARRAFPACCFRASGWTSSRGGCGADAAARARARRHAHGENPGAVRESRARHPRDRRSRRSGRDAGQHRPALQRHQYRPERHGHRRADGRRDPHLAEERPPAHRRAHGRPAARAAAALPRDAVLLPAGGHRQSGAQFRAAFADRHPGAGRQGSRRL